MGVDPDLLRRGLATPARNRSEHAHISSLEHDPDDHGIDGQLPTSDRRHEQWVLACGLFVDTAKYASLRLAGEEEKDERLRRSAIVLSSGARLNKRSGNREELAIASMRMGSFTVRAFVIISEDGP